MDCLYVCVYKGENESYLQVKMTLKHKGMYELTNYFRSHLMLLCCDFVDQGSLHPPVPQLLHNFEMK